MPLKYMDLLARHIYKEDNALYVIGIKHELGRLS